MYSLKSIYQKPTKTLCLLLITAALFCGLTATAFATTYPADHGKEAAAELQTLGILKGTDANGTLEIERQLAMFRPQQPKKTISPTQKIIGQLLPSKAFIKKA